MRRRFSRRKPKVVWLPVHGRDFANEPEQDNYGNGDGGILAVPNDGSLSYQAVPVTFDYTNSASAEEGTDYRSLHELTSANEYRLRRLVGKVWAGAEITDPGTYNPTVDVACGFIVNRTDDDGNILQINPLIDNGNERGPLHMDTADDPWIWRRRWLLTATGGPNNYLGPQWPETNAEYGSVHDGPHLNQKTARIIARQERLFFWIQARCVNVSVALGSPAINWGYDLRILASLRTNSGNRRNASR